ncbi:hypothetical protein [Jannaschia pohangensis]|uniref:Uncharacterized protein n=1 Tax=Jannaschia pohangensis TaxID=390807 RepID=A0A1I3UF84_9RHOB|nr:hypothetical protein [Jannaschia pohangensis]SFJ80461.1 hypothetical protein SAMN04488095_3709 [Jannaschia pohangensis]
MIRAAVLAAMLAAPADAATSDDCKALVGRLSVSVERVESIAGTCLMSDVRFGDTSTPWHADRISLGGDIDALPDALPRRLSGGVVGLALDPQIPGRPGLDWLMREQSRPGLSLTFDLAAEAGVLSIRSLRFRMDETNGLSLTARLAGVPEIWPVDPVAASAIRLQAMDLEIDFDGMFEALVLIPLGSAILDTTQAAEPQVAILRDGVRALLEPFAGTDQQANAEALQGFVDVLPHPRGVLSIGIGGTGLSAVQGMPFLTGTASPDFIARVASAAELDVQWTPDAP